jgi:CheY-like chemotaxis protein
MNNYEIKNKVKKLSNVSNTKPSLILIGEDDMDDQEILTEIFGEINKSFELKFLNSGRQLIKYLDELSQDDLPCLILLDYNMPELNGEEILKRINTNPRFVNIPKVVWSTSNASEYRERCIRAGAITYLVKPSTIQSLKESVSFLLSLC